VLDICVLIGLHGVVSRKKLCGQFCMVVTGTCVHSVNWKSRCRAVLMLLLATEQSYIIIADL